MTTVAFDGKILACDKQCTEDTVKTTMTKLIKINEDVYFSFAGAVCDIEKLKKFILMKKVKHLDPMEDETEGLILNISTGDCFHVDSNYRTIPIKSFTAIGSGKLGALVAMSLGKSAIEAIEHTSHFDLYTGKGVDFISIKPQHKTKKKASKKIKK